MIPRRMSRTGRRETRYFTSEAKAHSEIKALKEEHSEHGRSGVTADDRHWINVARAELGDLSILPEVIRHWKRTGSQLVRVTVREAVAQYLELAEADYPNKRTLNDIRGRLNTLAAKVGPRQTSELTPASVETYLAGLSSGWNRWSTYKRLRPFFKWAVRRHLIAADPLENVPKPKTPAPSRAIYTPDQFQSLIWSAEANYPELLAFVVLCGFCFMRTSELVAAYKGEQVLQWSDIHWDDGLIHVRPGVAKATKRGVGDERYIPLSDAAKRFLAGRPSTPKQHPSGPVIPYHARKFGQLWVEMTDAAGVERIDNGLRHSAISYALAANPEYGVALVSQWAGNSEATIRKHYRRLLKPAEGDKWFAVHHWAEEMERMRQRLAALRPQPPPEEEREAWEELEEPERPE